MQYNTSASLLSLQRGVARSREWSRVCYTLLSSKLREHNISIEKEKWDEVYACFRLDTFFSRDLPKCLDYFCDKVSLLSKKLSSSEIRDLVTKDMQREMSSIVVKPLTTISREELLYSTIEDAFSIDHSHLRDKGVIVNGLATERKDCYTLFEEDKSFGVYTGQHIGKVLCAVIPDTLFYSKHVMSLLKGKRYIVLSPMSSLEGEYKHQLGDSVYLASTEDVEIEPNPFPYRRSYLKLSQMIDNLNESEPIEWFAPVENYSLGVVTRPFETTYDSADSISDVFSEEVRIQCNEYGKDSPLDVWKEMEWKKLRMSTRDKRELVYSKARGCNLFNCALAVHCYRRFGGEGSYVLDPFGGYGDRMLGAWIAGCDRYTCFDTNPQLVPCYEKIEDVARELRIDYNIMPFESIVIKPKERNFYDVALLSPPFYDYELYVGEDTSTLKYKTLEDWNERFWKVCLYKTLAMVKKGGFVLLYIPTGKDKISVKMNEAVEEVYSEQKRYGVLGFLQTMEGAPNRIRSTIVYKKTN